MSVSRWRKTREISETYDWEFGAGLDTCWSVDVNVQTVLRLLARGEVGEDGLEDRVSGRSAIYNPVI